MEIVSDVKTLSSKIGISVSDLPVFFQKQTISFFLLDGVVIPFSVYKNYFLKLCKLEFYPLLNSMRLSTDDEKCALNEFVSYIKRNNVADRIVSPSNYVIFNAVPDNALICAFGTYQIDLAQSNEQLWANIHSKHRNVIRNAEKSNVEIKYGEDQIEKFYDLYQQTTKRSNIYCESLNHFKNIYQMWPENTLCGVAYYNNVLQGALFVPYTKFCAYYLYGASAEEIQVNGAINYLQWNTIKLLKQQNVKIYDFVGARLSDVSGTKLDGIQKFKSRFGSKLHKGYLWKMDISHSKCKIYDRLLMLKTRILGSEFPKDIIDQEIEKQQA